MGRRNAHRGLASQRKEGTSSAFESRVRIQVQLHLFSVRKCINIYTLRGSESAEKRFYKKGYNGDHTLRDQNQSPSHLASSCECSLQT